VGTSAAARENRSGAGGGLQGSGRLVLLSFASILELMFDAVASYVVSLNVHIIVMLCSVLVHVQVRLHLLLVYAFTEQCSSYS
jgi:hypothetical protein